MGFQKAIAQDAPAYRQLKIVVGGGYGHYINSFTNVNDENIVIHKPAFYSRIVWQPEYKLRLGFEAGYYQLYSTDRIQVDDKSKVLTTTMDAIPLFLFLSMEVYKNIELTFGTGWSKMNYSVKMKKSNQTVLTGDITSSLNYSVGCLYNVPISKRFDVGLEFKYTYFNKTIDQHLLLMLYTSYKIKSWQVK